MSSLRLSLLATATCLVASVASAQDPLICTNFWQISSTFSLDPRDPEPIRSMYQAVEVDRAVKPSEVHVFTESLTNARTVQARYFQRPSGRGTFIVVVEVQAVPRHPGKAARAAYQIDCGVYGANSIDPAIDVRQSHHDDSYFYMEALEPDNGFKVIYPKAGTVMAYVQVVNPFVGPDPTDLIPVEADSTHRHGHANKVDVFKEKAQIGLVQASAIVANVADGDAPWASASYLNLKVHPHEWREIRVQPVAEEPLP